MRRNFLCAAILMLFSLPFAAESASAQADYAYHQNYPRYTVGAGLSAYNMDFGHGKMLGPTVWADWNPPFFPGFLHGLAIEASYRNSSWHRDEESQPEGFHFNTFGGGLLYHARLPFLDRFHRLMPYAKGEVYYGSLTDRPPDVPFRTETRTVYALGGGLDYRLYHKISVRADFEYQTWPDMYGHKGESLNPGGVTLGALYSFGGHAW